MSVDAFTRVAAVGTDRTADASHVVELSRGGGPGGGEKRRPSIPVRQGRPVPASLRWLAIAFLVSLSFDALPWADVFGEGDTLSSVVGLVLAVAFVIAGRLRLSEVRGSAWRWFVVFAAVSAATELGRWLSLPSMEAARSLRVFSTTVQVLAMYAIFRSLAEDPRVRVGLLRAFVVTSGVLALLGNFGLAGESRGLASGRASILERNENELAVSFGLAAVCLVWWLLSSPRLSQPKRLAATFLAASLIFGVIRTGSRGGALATVTAIAIVVILTFRLRSAAMYLAVVPIISWAGGVALSSESVLASRFVAAIEGTDRGTRPELIDAGLRVATRSPWIGVGPAHDVLLGQELGFSRISAHNTWLQVGLSFGIVGLVPYALFIGLTARRVWRRRLEREGVLALAAVSMLLVEFVFTHTMNNKITWIVLAIAGAVGARAAARRAANGEAARRRPGIGRLTVHAATVGAPDSALAMLSTQEVLGGRSREPGRGQYSMEGRATCGTASSRSS